MKTLTLTCPDQMHEQLERLDDELWPKYSRQSVTNLMKLGFSREEAEAYFPDAKQR